MRCCQPEQLVWAIFVTPQHVQHLFWDKHKHLMRLRCLTDHTLYNLCPFRLANVQGQWSLSLAIPVVVFTAIHYWPGLASSVDPREPFTTVRFLLQHCGSDVHRSVRMTRGWLDAFMLSPSNRTRLHTSVKWQFSHNAFAGRFMTTWWSRHFSPNVFVDH